MPPRQPRSSNLPTHGASCLTGCLDHFMIQPGSILVYNGINAESESEYGVEDQLVIMLRPPVRGTARRGKEALYHCVMVNRFPTEAIGAAHRVVLVQENELPHLDYQKLPYLLAVQHRATASTGPTFQLDWHPHESVQPANVRRIPLRSLHALPCNSRVTLHQSSVNSLLKRIDCLAHSMGDPVQNITLPQALQYDIRVREDIMTLNLLGMIERCRRVATRVEPSTVPAPLRSDRRTSIWDTGTIPRKGGRSLFGI